MTMKFWSVSVMVSPRMMANVMVVVAIVMQVRFFMNSLVRSRWGTTKRIIRKLSSEATIAYTMVDMRSPKIQRLSHCEFSLGWYFLRTVCSIVLQWRFQFFRMLT